MEVHGSDVNCWVMQTVRAEMGSLCCVCLEVRQWKVTVALMEAGAVSKEDYSEGRRESRESGPVQLSEDQSSFVDWLQDLAMFV